MQIRLDVFEFGHLAYGIRKYAQNPQTRKPIYNTGVFDPFRAKVSLPGRPERENNNFSNSGCNWRVMLNSMYLTIIFSPNSRGIPMGYVGVPGSVVRKAYIIRLDYASLLFTYRACTVPTVSLPPSCVLLLRLQASLVALKIGTLLP